MTFDDILKKGFSEIGCISHLLNGYNIIDKSGNVIRKQKFLSLYPDDARKLLNEIYVKYHSLKYINSFDYFKLNYEIYNCIGFTIVRTKNYR